MVARGCLGLWVAAGAALVLTGCAGPPSGAGGRRAGCRIVSSNRDGGA
ncbi:hypothetical protein [Microbacterium gorillae]|nr:hypothetical protein [Microbacterium gorillae]